MANYAQFETREARLSSDFGEEMARKWFGDEVVDALPKYVRGKSAGKPKGFYVWTKVVRGGWVRGSYGGGVENRVGTIIERKLCKQESGPGGAFCGETIHSLGVGETLQVKIAEREKARKLARLDNHLVWLEEFRAEMKVLGALRCAVRDGSVPEAVAGPILLDVKDMAKRALDEMKKIEL